MKPYVICHMNSSVDGRILGSRWRPSENRMAGLFERIHEELRRMLLSDRPGRAFRLMRETGVVLSLKADPEESIRRMRVSKRAIEARPLLAKGDPLEALRRLSLARARYYARADLQLDTSHLDVEAVAAAAVGLLRSVEGPLVARRTESAEGVAAPEGET